MQACLLLMGNVVPQTPFVSGWACAPTDQAFPHPRAFYQLARYGGQPVLTIVMSCCEAGRSVMRRNRSLVTWTLAFPCFLEQGRPNSWSWQTILLSLCLWRLGALSLPLGPCYGWWLLGQRAWILSARWLSLTKLFQKQLADGEGSTCCEAGGSWSAGPSGWDEKWSFLPYSA